jgi:hypothetical protein
LRWQDDIGKIIIGVPWRTSNNDPEQDGLVPLIPFFPPMVEQQPISEAVVPRRVYIRKEDVEKFGYTPKCPSCKALLQKKPTQTHSEAFRLRIEEQLKDTERFKVARKRESELLEKTLEGEDKKRKTEEKTVEDTRMHEQTQRKRDSEDEGDQDDHREENASPGGGPRLHLQESA